MYDFDEFVRARSASLARAAYLLTGDLHRGEELVQEALTRAAQRWSRIVADGEDPEPYVRPVYTRAVDSWRRRRVSEDVRPEPFDAAPPAAEDQRAVLALRFFEDRTEVETAQLLSEFDPRGT